MCQMATQIEELCRRGMPRKIGKSVHQKRCTDRTCRDSKHFSEEYVNEVSATKEITMTPSSSEASAEVDQANVLNASHKHLTRNMIVSRMSQTTAVYTGDILAIFTIATKQCLRRLNEMIENVQKSNSYKVLSKTTQPAHVIAVAILSFVLLAVWPNIIDEEATYRPKERKSALALVAYLGAFAAHFGVQIWMTFVSGLALYFTLPRHTFGLCQQVLFPKYFALNSILSILTLIMFVKVFGGRWEFSSYVQVIALTVCAVIEVAVRLYLSPPLLRLMREKNQFEAQVGSGQEVGQLDQKTLVRCPRYMKIHKSFRRIHMTVAMGNLTVLVCTFLHLNYLASKITLS